jgi:hypothetical protein
VSFEANNRNYRQPNQNFTVSTRSDAQGGTYGMFLLGPISNMLIEDCSLQYFRTGISIQAVPAWGSPNGVTLRRTVLADQYVQSFDSAGHYVTSEGIYAEGVNNLVMEENIFDHNGWMDPAFGNFGAFASIYNHNAYINDGCSNVTVNGNIFANGSSHGLQLRSGGWATNNLFLNNPIAMSFGYENGHEKPGGVFGEISGNIIYGARDISGQDRGWGLEIGNLTPKANGGGTVVKNNIYAGYTIDGQPAIQLSTGSNTVNPETAVGINDLTIQNNIVYGWTRGVYINPGFNLGGTGRWGFKNVQWLNNEFQQVNATPIINHGPNLKAGVETWNGNRYDIQGADNANTQYYLVKGSSLTLAQWQAQVEPTAISSMTGGPITYPDPTRSPASYNATKGGAATTDDFMSEARKLSSRFYRTAYTAAAVNDYMKAGFAGQRNDAFAPTGQLIASNITAAGGASQTFTITWIDDNQINFSSIGNGDVLVTGPGGYSQAATLVSANANADGSVVAAIYSVAAPSGAWSAAANGTYTVSAQAGQVLDKSGNSTPAASIGAFNVNIAAGAPTASLVTSNVTNTTAGATLTVTYAATGGGIDISTLDSNDLMVTGPNGFTTTASFVSVAPATNGSPRVATYVIDPPSGGWTPASNGTYTVSVQSGEVASTLGTVIGNATLGTFTVHVTVPTATADGPTINSRTSAAQVITVIYTDVSGITPRRSMPTTSMSTAPMATTPMRAPA